MAVHASLDRHPNVGRLAQQPLAGGIGERHAQRIGLDLEPEIARRESDRPAFGNFERRRGPDSRLDVRHRLPWIRTLALGDTHAHDPGAADGDLDRAPRKPESKSHVPALDTHGAASGCGRHENSGRSRSGRKSI